MIRPMYDIQSLSSKIDSNPQIYIHVLLESTARLEAQLDKLEAVNRVSGRALPALIRAVDRQAIGNAERDARRGYHGS